MRRTFDQPLGRMSRTCSLAARCGREAACVEVAATLEAAEELRSVSMSRLVVATATKRQRACGQAVWGFANMAFLIEPSIDPQQGSSAKVLSTGIPAAFHIANPCRFSIRGPKQVSASRTAYGRVKSFPLGMDLWCNRRRGGSPYRLALRACCLAVRLGRAI